MKENSSACPFNVPVKSLSNVAVRDMAGDFLAFDLERNRRRPAALIGLDGEHPGPVEIDLCLRVHGGSDEGHGEHQRRVADHPDSHAHPPPADGKTSGLKGKSSARYCRRSADRHRESAGDHHGDAARPDRDGEALWIVTSQPMSRRRSCTSATIEKTVTAACVNGFFTTVLLFDRAARKSASDCAGR